MFSIYTLRNITKISIVYSIFFTFIIFIHGFKFSEEIIGGTKIFFSSSKSESETLKILPNAKIENKHEYSMSFNANDKKEIEEAKNTIQKLGKVQNISSSGATISKYVIKSLATSCLVAFFGVFVYVFFRFNIKFATAGIYAILHDVVACFFVASVFNLEISLMVIVGILTTIGYSINNTIVVFDKIREGLSPDLKTSVSNTVMISIQKVFKRSILTSLSTLCAAICIFLFPDRAIQNFATITITGILFGTFSSLFIATGMLGLLKISKPKKKKQINYMHYAS